MRTPITIPMCVATTEVTYEVDVAIAIGASTHDTYEGDYVVIPKAFEDQILETNGLLMADDVTVLQVPYFETVNPTGKTVYIANEV